jgi:hypothetical protein
MSGADRLIGDFRRLPRIVRIGLGAAAAILLFLFINDYVWAIADDWNQKADTLQALIAESQRRESRLSREEQNLVTVFGPVSMPTDTSTGSQEMAQAVHEVIKSYGIEVANFNYVANAGTKLPREVLADVADLKGQRFDRLRAEVKLDTTTEVVAKILADLESRSEIEAISSLRIVRHENPPKVNMSFIVECWVKSGTVDRRRGGGA